MKKLILLALFSVLLCLTNGENEKVNVNPEPKPAPPPANITTTAAPPTTPTPTTPPPPPPTTPPPPPPTTTPPPPPTTQPPTTQPPTPEPTTPPTTPTTTTTTTAPTTSAPTSKPTPKPKPEVHTWYVNNTGTNRTCIGLKMILQIEIPYETKDNKTANATLVVPPTAIATGNNCVFNATEQSLTLTWNMTVNISNMVTFTFKKNHTKFTLHSVVAEIEPDAEHFPNATDNSVIIANHTKDEFSTPVEMSYRCKQDEYLSVPIDNHTGRFVISNLQIQAFRNSTTRDFDAAKDCEAGETPGIVPIAVGCSLAALIIIVLIAYLVGRRRSQARGYLSM